MAEQQYINSPRFLGVPSNARGWILDRHREVNGLQKIYWIDDSLTWHGMLVPTPGGEFDGWKPEDLPGRGLQSLARALTADCKSMSSPALGHPVVWRVLYFAEFLKWECDFGWESQGNSHLEGVEY